MSLKTISLKEYEKKSVNDSDLQTCLLLPLEKYLEKNKLSSAIKISSNSIKARSYVGIIKFKNIQIEILPKLITPIQNDENLSEKQKEEYRQNILKNLLFMLSFTKKLDIKTKDTAKLAKSQNPFLEVLIREYAKSLFDCLKRITPKNYIREEGNLKFLKGKLKFSENIKYNFANQARFYCEYDEYSEDCVLNQLFYYVSSALYEVSKDNNNKKMLKLIIDYYSDIKLVRFDKYKAEKIRLNRNQQLFDKPFKIAKMFVENSTVDLSKNCFENITLLWDMNKLFEEFIYQIIKRNLSDKLNKITSQRKRHLLSNSKNERRDTLVDIMLETKEKNKIVLDTKYKKFTSLDDISSADIYQVCTYCTLHDIKANGSQAKTPQAILLYPKFKNGEKPDITNYYLNAINNDLKYNIHFRSVNLLYLDLEKNIKVLTEELENVLRLKN